MPYDIWAEIDLDALSGNIKGLKALLDPGVLFMAVVKADAYGHGAVETARAAVSAGADALAVARLGEAVELRHAGITAPVLILGKTRPEYAEKLVDYDLTQTVSSFKEAAAFSARAVSLGTRIRVHVKIDTGMGRLGLVADGVPGVCRGAGERGAADEVASLYALEGLLCEGICTHFASADDADKTAAGRQLALFLELTDILESRGIHFQIRHAANSAAVIDLPASRLDMVRPGLSIYGYYPSEAVSRESVRLTPVMTLFSRIVHVKRVGAGFSVSYGATEQTRAETNLATVAVGYADGYSRLLSSKGQMAVRGITVPVVGRVCMDFTMVDAGCVPGISENDAAVVFGPPETGAPTADDIARWSGTISYEVLTSVSKRVPRLYVKMGSMPTP